MKIRLVHGAGPALELEAASGTLLSRAIWLSGRIEPLPLCAGLGRCGLCRVRFLRDPPPPLPEEEARLTFEDLAQGWRLACRRQIFDDSAPLDLELSLGISPDISDASSVALPEEIKTAKDIPLLLAVDVGTTSVQWRALAAIGKNRGKTTARGAFLNPQAGAGADVMSRLAFAVKPEGRHTLSDLIRASLRRVIERLAGKTGRVEFVCLAANTAMTDIFLERDVSGLCAAPYRLGHNGHETVRPPDLPPVYIPPLPAPFVGGDAACALLALLHAGTSRPFVLADLGTNAEMALVTKAGEIFMTSVPLGPALEGIGMECGCLAGPDAVTRFSLTPAGLAPFAAGLARGISATGYISLLALLRRLDLLDESGHFIAPEACVMPLARRIAAGLVRERGRLRLPLPGGLWLSAVDVEEVLKVRAAFVLALEKLLAAGGVAAGEVARLCLAGALGEHVIIEDLVTLGFVPPGPEVLPVGNAALDGAALLALQPKKGKGLARICRKARLIFPAQERSFQREYLERIAFPVQGRQWEQPWSS
ncbi:MAG: ASKHA domain-containing protein [Desulfovibrio sp.]|nr:ASKHA domain-containing protein [Desulfovibrio sp.]